MKILLLSNNPISKTNSNGKTIGNLLANFSKDEICNFYITDDNRDDSRCSAFFMFYLKDIMKSFFTFRKIYNVCENQCESQVNTVNASIANPMKKTAFKMLIRNKLYRRATKQESFKKWIENQKISVVILQAGDLPFFYDLAVEISTKYNVPFIIYSTEEYPFKEYDYFKRTLHTGFYYNIFHNKLLKSAKNAYSLSSKTIFLTDDLRDLYVNRFSIVNTEVIYNSYDKNLENNEAITDINTDLKISYCGNLDNSRWKGIIDIASVLCSIDNKLHIDVYGKCFDQDGIYELNNNESIRYHGFVTYDEYVKITKETDIILYTESKDYYSNIDLKYAFSTKIPDSLFTGKAFLCYLPKELSSSKYLISHNCAYVSDSLDALEKQIRIIIDRHRKNEDLNIFKKEAINTSINNHDPIKNSAKVEELIKKLVTRS